MADRWTKKQERSLLQGVGIYALLWFTRHSGKAYDWPNAPHRGRNAIYSKARRLYGNGGLTRGAYTIHQIVQTTGYSKSQIRRAMRALAQKWKRLSPKGSYLIYEEQCLDLVQWLGTDYWSKMHRLYNCLWCHKTEFNHSGKGLCLRCYRRYIKALERYKLPSDNKELLMLVKQHLVDAKAEKQLMRGRALPEPTVKRLKEVVCLTW